MPPKAKTSTTSKRSSKIEKKGTTKSNVNKSSTPADATIQESRADLLAKIQAVEREAVKANEHRNYMELERDKIDAFWEITKSELDCTRVELRDTQRKLEMMSEQYSMELRLQSYKVKQVKHEQLEMEAKIRTECDEEALRLREECQQHILPVNKAIENTEERFRSTLREHDERVRKLKLEHGTNLRSARELYEQISSSQVKQVEQETLQTMDTLRSCVNGQLGDAEERYAAYIDQLVRSHTNAYEDLKHYFSELTDAQVLEIERLKQQLNEKSDMCMKQTVTLNEIREENTSLVEPLAQAQQILSETQRRLDKAERRCAQLEQSEKTLKHVTSRLKEALWQNELLVQRLESVDGGVHASHPMLLKA